MKKKIMWIAGVDEAGRGPLAGPVAVGVAVVPKGFDWDCIPGVGDSKKVTARNREAIFARARVLRAEGRIDYTVTLVSASQIDKKGISKAVRIGIEKSVKALNLDPNLTSVRLDGLLTAPLDFRYQETITKGDSKEKIIGLASIVAKVTRDRYMGRIAKRHPEYDFHIHKGYGTKKHRALVKKLGPTPMHRKTFITRIV